MAELQHVTLRITGRVQGVFYRLTAKKKADQLGVKGFIRNVHDGSVYVEAEAEESVIYKFIKWCNTGPSGAEVDHVEVMVGDAKNFESFDIVK